MPIKLGEHQSEVKVNALSIISYIPPDKYCKSRVNCQAPSGKERTDMRATTNSAIMVIVRSRPTTYSDSIETAFRRLLDNFGAGFDVVWLHTACRSSSLSVMNTPLHLAICSKTSMASWSRPSATRNFGDSCTSKTKNRQMNIENVKTPLVTGISQNWHKSEVRGNTYRVNLNAAVSINLVPQRHKGRFTMCIAIPYYQIWGTGHPGLKNHRRNWQWKPNQSKTLLIVQMPTKLTEESESTTIKNYRSVLW